MVSIAKENVFSLREYLLAKVMEKIGDDCFKFCFIHFLNLAESQPPFDFSILSLYQKCAVSGLKVLTEKASNADLFRLLGQAAKIDSTPSPWVSDMFGVLAVKWLAEEESTEDATNKFNSWAKEFLPNQISSNRLSIFEKDIASYILAPEDTIYSSACIPLFLHYCNIQKITDHQKKQKLIEKFMNEFKGGAQADHSVCLQGLMIYVFDHLNQEAAFLPPNGWSRNDLLNFLENIPVGLKRWTWEDAPRTKGALPVKWQIENEYHVQNLLYVLLAPIFPDVSDEVYLEQVGQKTPRIDLYLPSLHTIIEVKYRKDTKKAFSNLIGEIAEDASLYRSDQKYKDSVIVSFLWDNTRSTQEHTKFKAGVTKLDGIDGCVIVSAPSTMAA